MTFSQWRGHPWHGLSAGPTPPSIVNVFVEITPFDLVKYEVDKASGYLKVDRAQRTSSLPPSIYGFIRRSYAGAAVAALMPGAVGGDRDPLDICVLSERLITRAEVLLHARVVVGLPMLDTGAGPTRRPVASTRSSAGTMARRSSRSRIRRIPCRSATCRRAATSRSLDQPGGPTSQ